MAGNAEEEDLYRRESIAAFAHEVRTPLTAIRMVLELADREGEDGRIVLDGELAGMLNTSVDGLQQLVDDLQEASRLERGKVRLSRGPSELAQVIDAARAIAGSRITLTVDGPADRSGPWDASRLARALADFATTANRLGDGSGAVTLVCTTGGDDVTLMIASGIPSGDKRGIGTDAGFGFFHARLVVLAMGGSVAWHREERYFEATVRLPA